MIRLTSKLIIVYACYYMEYCGKRKISLGIGKQPHHPSNPAILHGVTHKIIDSVPS